MTVLVFARAYGADPRRGGPFDDAAEFVQAVRKGEALAFLALGQLDIDDDTAWVVFKVARSDPLGKLEDLGGDYGAQSVRRAEVSVVEESNLECGAQLGELFVLQAGNRDPTGRPRLPL